MIPCGVQGTRPGFPEQSLPVFTGWNPSTSLSGRTASSVRSVSTWEGRGICTRMASIRSDSLSLWTTASSSSVVVSSGSSTASECIPNSRQDRILLAT